MANSPSRYWRISASSEIETRRTFPNHPPKSTLAYFDAAGPGHISYADIAGTRRKRGRAQVPKWRTNLAGIYEFESASALFAPRAAAIFALAVPILLCTDNDGAASAVIRGNCNSPSLRVSENRGFLSLTKYEPERFHSKTLLLSS